MKEHLILSYFTLDSEGYYKCKNCSVQHKLPILDTLKKHYARVHKTIWNKIKKPVKKSIGQSIVKGQDRNKSLRQDESGMRQDDIILRQNEVARQDVRQDEVTKNMQRLIKYINVCNWMY